MSLPDADESAWFYQDSIVLSKVLRSLPPIVPGKPTKILVDHIVVVAKTQIITPLPAPFREAYRVLFMEIQQQLKNLAPRFYYALNVLSSPFRAPTLRSARTTTRENALILHHPIGFHVCDACLLPEHIRTQCNKPVNLPSAINPQ